MTVNIHAKSHYNPSIFKWYGFFWGDFPPGKEIGRISKNEEDEFLGKVPGNMHTKFYCNPSQFKNYGISGGVSPLE